MITLASRSPRRRDLLTWAGFDIDVAPTCIDESRHPADDPVSHACGLAERKALAGPDDRVVIGADTVVHRGDVHFDTPIDRDEARAHLIALSGDWHDVTTAVCVRNGLGSRVFSVTTAVRFRALLLPEIEAYLATGEADDKAGAYGIQGAGGVLVAEIRGSWTNVMGLPVEETIAALAEIGVYPWERR